MISGFMFGGVRVFEAKPFKIMKPVLRVCKSKVGRRNIRVQVFDKWKDALKDGEVLQDIRNNCMYMNARDIRRLNNIGE